MIAPRDRPRERVKLPIFDPAFKANPHSFYDALRTAGGPIVPIRLPTGVEAWLVLEHAEARRLLSDPRLSKRTPHRPAHHLFDHLLTMDPPDHTRLRAIAAREFSPQRVRMLRPRITKIATELLEGIASRGDVDLIEAFALPLPLRVICELLGIPVSDVPRVSDWSARLLAADLDDPARVPDIARELHEYLVALAGEKGPAPDDGLFSAFVGATERGEMTREELTAMAFLLLVAGHETTVNLIGNSVLALMRDRGQWNMLCADGKLAGAAVEELLRYVSPLDVATARFATADIELGDTCICAGDTVFVGLGAANRDERCFEDAGRLDVERRNAGDHVAFGYGVHYCLGAALARLEGEIALMQLTARFPDLELAVPADELQWKPGLIMRGLEQLPVRFQPARRAG